MVGYPTQVSDLDLAPDHPILMFSRNFYSAFLCLFYEPLLDRTDLFCLLRDHCARSKPWLFHRSDASIIDVEDFSMSLWGPYKGVLRWLKFDRVGGGCKQLEK